MQKLLFSLSLIGVLSPHLYAMDKKEVVHTTRHTNVVTLEHPQSYDLVEGIKKEKTKVLNNDSFNLSSRYKTWSVKLGSIPTEDKQLMHDLSANIQEIKADMSASDYFDAVYTLSGLRIVYDQASLTTSDKIKAQVTYNDFAVPLMTFLINRVHS